jgi:hypothetical protein
VLVSVLSHPAGRPDHEAQEDVGEAPRDATRVDRGDRGHHVLGRAERVILVAVLDVGNAVSIEEPRAELDPLLERGSVEPRFLPLCVPLQNGAEVLLHTVPVQLDVVVAVDEGECMSVCDEPRELGEDVAVTDGHPTELQAGVLGGVAEAVLPLFVVRRCGQLGWDGDGHADEVDEVPGDDDAPPVPRGFLAAIVLEEEHQIPVDRRRTVRDVGCAVVQVAPEMYIGEDKKTLGRSGL